MKLGEAMEVLGLVGTAVAELTDEDVKIAFRLRCKQFHPDMVVVQYARGIVPKWTMDEVGAARDTLLNRRNVSEFACKQCKGKGTVPARMGVKPCGACKGTGETHGS